MCFLVHHIHPVRDAANTAHNNPRTLCFQVHTTHPVRDAANTAHNNPRTLCFQIHTTHPVRDAANTAHNNPSIWDNQQLLGRLICIAEFGTVWFGFCRQYSCRIIHAGLLTLKSSYIVLVLWFLILALTFSMVVLSIVNVHMYISGKYRLTEKRLKYIWHVKFNRHLLHQLLTRVRAGGIIWSVRI